MAASQAEFNAFKTEVTSNMAKLETAAIKSSADVAAVQAVLVELQQSYSQISLQAAPWSAAISAEVAASEAKATEALAGIRALYDVTKTEVEELRRRATDIEKKGGGEKKNKWELSRPKDIEPDIFGSKEEHWAKFKDGIRDFADAVHNGLKAQLDWALKQRDEVTRDVLARNPLASTTEEHWDLRYEVFKLLKRKTEVASEARKIIETVGDSNGYEAWRLLGVRYEPQVGMKRLRELGEFTKLQNRRCKNTAETAGLIFEIDLRKKQIADIGGRAPDDDVCQHILWMSMDATTRAHVTGKLDMDNVGFMELRQVVQSFCNLIASTNIASRGSGAVPMDIGTISTAPSQPGGVVISDDAWPTESEQGRHQLDSMVAGRSRLAGRR